jgi:hypothetical protein
MSVKKRVRELAAELLAMYEAWSDEVGNELIDSEFFDIGRELFSIYDPSEQPNAAHAMTRLSHQLAAFEERVISYTGATELRPPSGFATELDVAVKALLAEPPQLHPLPTARQMSAQGIRPRQIALAWKLFKSNGEPDEEAAVAEIANPGSVITPEHIAKVDLARLGALGFGPMAEYEYQPHESHRKSFVPPSQKVPTEVINPPSMEKMILDGCTVEQIARRMAKTFGKDPESYVPAILDKASELGRTLAMNAQEVRNGSVADRILAEERSRSVPQGLGSFGPGGLFDENDKKSAAAAHAAFFARPGQQPAEQEPAEVAPEIVERVAALVDEGHDHAAIAEELGIPHQVVEDAIKCCEATAE